MGKDSLIKSTTKKSSAKKDKKPSKKKTAAKPSGAQPIKEAPAKTKTAKKAEPVRTIQDLLLKKFVEFQPPSGSLPPAPDLTGMSAPPFIASADPQEVERLEALLAKRFSMEEINAAAQEPAPVASPIVEAAPPRPPVSLDELLFKKFAEQPLDDAPLPVPDLSGMSAPPFIASTDPQEVERLEALLAKRFSMEEINAAAQEPAPVAPPIVEAAPPRPPVSLDELLFKKFSEQPLDDAPLPAPDLSGMSAPPFIASTDPQEVERLEALLAKHFSMEEINAAAQEPAPVAPPIVEAAPSPQEVEPVKSPEPQVETPAQAAAAPEPVAEPLPAQTPERPQAPPAEMAASAPPIAQAPIPSAPPVEAPKPTLAPSPEPAAPKIEEKKTPSPLTPTAPKPVTVAAPPKEEAKIQVPPATTEPKPADSGWRNFKIGIGAVLALFLLILWGSLNNSGKYFVTSKKGAIEIWQGTFSPTGKQFIAVLHGVEPAGDVKPYYSKEEIFPILYNYYVGKADALLDVSGLPDYKSISDYLRHAQAYARTDDMRAAVQNRMDNIQRLSLMYKADIDMSKGTIPSLQSAVQTLKEVQRLTTEPSQLETLNRKIAAASAALAAMEAKAQAERPAPANADQSPPKK
jgi:hypothetical protein